MALQKIIKELAGVYQGPCVTISFNTHRTYPDNTTDRIWLKNFAKEASERVIEEYGKRPAAALLDKLEKINEEVDENYNLDSLHIFLSNNIHEIVRSIWPVAENHVRLDNTFDIDSLIKACNRSEEYYILLLSQGGVHLYEAINDSIIREVHTHHLPSGETPYYETDHEKRSDAKLMDRMIENFFNDIDKYVLEVIEPTGEYCIVVCTEDNYGHLMKVANKPEVYQGYCPIDYNHTATHEIVKQTWELVRERIYKQRTVAIEEMREAVGESGIATDLNEIYQAVMDGRGDMLIVYEDYSQPVRMTGDRTFELVDDATLPGITDDIVPDIVREVIAKDGRVFFTMQDEIKDLGEICLKLRY